jgi:hypothetical protein
VGRRKPPSEQVAAVAELVERAEAGEVAALPELRRALSPEHKMWSDLSDMIGVSILGILRKSFPDGDTMSLKEIGGYRAQLHALAKDLAGPQPSPLERVLAERIAVNWLQLTYMDAELAAGIGTDGRVDKERDHRHVQVHRRYLDSVKMLATVRRLLGPNVHLTQINVDARQER